MPETTLLERPQLAAQQLLSGNTSGAWDAMLAPQNLSQKEHDEYLTKLGIKGTVYESIFQSITSPLLIISLILSHKFPPAVGEGLLKVSQEVGSLSSKIPFFGKWLSQNALFRGTAVPELFDGVAAENMAFKKWAGLREGANLDKFITTMGRTPNAREQVLVGAYTDGLHRNLRGFSGGKTGKVRIGSGITAVELDGVGTLFKDLESKMHPALREYAKDVRTFYNDAHAKFYGEPGNRKRLMRVLAQHGLEGDGAAEFVLHGPQMMDNYFPHRGLKTFEDFQLMITRMTQSGSSKQYGKNAVAKADNWISDEVRKRQFAMLPSWTDLAVVKDVIDPAAYGRLEAIVKARTLHAARLGGVRESIIQKLQKLEYGDIATNYSKYLQPAEAATYGEAVATHAPQQYSLRSGPVLASYVHTLAGTYAWTAKGYGEKLTRELNTLKALSKGGNPYAKMRTDIFENALMPMAMGRQTFQKAVKAQAWHMSMAHLASKLDTPWVTKLLGEPMVKQLQEHVINSRGAFNLMGLQQKASGFLYLSTLGLNPGSALRNTLQNVLTLGPVVGWETAATAMGNVMGQSHKYLALRLGERALSHEAAIAKVFPHFAEAGLNAGHLTEEVVEQSLRSAYDLAILPSGVKTLYEKISRGMMSLFTASETVNRLTSFEAGMIHAKRAGMAIDAAIPFAREIVKKTQFTITPTSGPLHFANWGPIAKQFVYFPTKMLEFATSTAITLGSGAIDPLTGKEMNISNVLFRGKAVPFGKYNPGTAARMVAGSILAMEVGDVLGIDFRSGLLESSVPTLQPVKTGSPFGALPVVPPGIGIAGSFLYGASTGEWDAFRHTFPLLVPGGVALTRGVGLLPPAAGGRMGASIARTLDRTYADYEQPAPDGRIAVYSGKGTFRGYYTPWDLLKQGLGVRSGDLPKEQEVLALITKNRDTIGSAKRDYLDARYRNSAREATIIATGFKQKFGFDVPVSDQDVKAMQTRRHISRLEQMIRTSPVGPARDSMIAAVQASIGASAQAMMGVDPALLGGSRSAMEQSRWGSGRGTGPARFSAQGDMSPLDQLNPSTLGRQPGVSQMQAIP